MTFRQHDPLSRRLEALGFSRAGAGKLSRYGTLLDVRRDALLCSEGERGLQAFLVVEGEAQVLTGEAVITVGPGAVVGELATLDPHRRRNATVVAHTDVAVLVFDVRTYRMLAGDADLRDRLAPQRVAA